MLTLLFGRKNEDLAKKQEASMDEKRMEIYLKSDIVRRF